MYPASVCVVEACVHVLCILYINITACLPAYITLLTLTVVVACRIVSPPCVVIFIHLSLLVQEGKYVRTSVSVDLPEFPPTKGIQRSDVSSKDLYWKVSCYVLCTSQQVKPGTGFVCEPFEGRSDRTLVTQLVHVCYPIYFPLPQTCTAHFSMYVQIDFEGLPVVIVNQAMKRHPMCIHYIREALTGSRRKKRAVTARPSATKSEDEADKQNDSENECTVNDRFSHSYAYGEEVPVKDFLVGHPEHKPQPESVVVIPIDRHKLEGPTTSHPPNDRDPTPHSNGLEMEHNDMQNSTTKLMTQF